MGEWLFVNRDYIGDIGLSISSKFEAFKSENFKSTLKSLSGLSLKLRISWIDLYKYIKEG